MNAKELFSKSLSQADSCIRRIEISQLGFSTPCTEWDLKALINHMVYELLWMPDLLGGKTVAEIGDAYDGDVLGDDVQGAWQRAADAAQKAVDAADLEATVHLSRGETPVSQYINEMAMDICIHGWDAAQSTKCNLIIDEQVATVLYDFILPHHDAMVGSGSFAPAVKVADDADIQTKLLALTGRHAERTDDAN